MAKDRLSELTMDFAVEIVLLSQALEDRHEYVLSRQIRAILISSINTTNANGAGTPPEA